MLWIFKCSKLYIFKFQKKRKHCFFFEFCWKNWIIFILFYFVVYFCYLFVIFVFHLSFCCYLFLNNIVDFFLLFFLINYFFNKSCFFFVKYILILCFTINVVWKYSFWKILIFYVSKFFFLNLALLQKISCFCCVKRKFKNLFYECLKKVNM